MEKCIYIYFNTHKLRLRIGFIPKLYIYIYVNVGF